MNFTKKFDRAFQWAGEKMGQEARTTTTEEFRNLETEMALRFDGMYRIIHRTCTIHTHTHILLLSLFLTRLLLATL